GRAVDPVQPRARAHEPGDRIGAVLGIGEIPRIEWAPHIDLAPADLGSLGVNLDAIDDMEARYPPGRGGEGTGAPASQREDDHADDEDEQERPPASQPHKSKLT